jgi:hypothetical protein
MSACKRGAAHAYRKAARGRSRTASPSAAIALRGEAMALFTHYEPPPPLSETEDLTAEFVTTKPAGAGALQSGCHPHKKERPCN